MKNEKDQLNEIQKEVEEKKNVLTSKYSIIQWKSNDLEGHHNNT